MKTKLVAVATVFAVATFFADTLRIGSFLLPYRFEDNNLSEIVRYVVTNDVQAYSTRISGFMSPYQDSSGSICVQRSNTPTIVDRSDLFNDNVKFYIENGNTNCVIKHSLTDAAKLMECEMSLRTNLLVRLHSFVCAFSSGSATNYPPEEKRKLMRHFEGFDLAPMSEEDYLAEDFADTVRDICENFDFLPPCVLEMSKVEQGTNTFYTIPLRYSMIIRGKKREVIAETVIFANDYWSLLEH